MPSNDSPTLKDGITTSFISLDHRFLLQLEVIKLICECEIKKFKEMQAVDLENQSPL